MRIKFWGVRGSLPAPLTDQGLTAKLFEAVAGAQGVDLTDADAIRAYLARLPFYVGGVVGGNTTCVEVQSGEHTIVIDAGSGIRPLGLSLLGRGFDRGQGTIHLFFTHAHWDHLMGFPFFKPAYVRGNRIICYAVDHHPLEYLRHLMTEATFFPINPGQLPATLEFVTLNEGQEVRIGDVRINTIRLHHPGVAFAYRIDEGESSFVFSTDAEFKLLDDEYTQQHVDFFQGADVLAFDAQFSLNDAFTYEDWGHSSAIIGVDLAIRAGVKRLVTVHHDPNNTDRQIWEVAEAAQAYARLSPGGEDLEVTVGHEGLEVVLSGSEEVRLTETIEQRATVLTLSGPLGLELIDELQQRLSRIVSSPWRRPLAVELVEIKATDPEAIADLCSALRAMRDIPLSIIVPSHRLRLAMSRHLSAYRHRLRLYDDRASALAAMVGPSHLWMQGGTLAGRYQLKALLKTDDRSAMYEAVDLQMNRPVLAHVLNPELTHDARLNALETFRGWSRLNHPGLIQVLDILPDEEGLTVLILEAPGGQTLKEIFRAAGQGDRLHVPEAVGLGGRLLDVLAYLHSQGIAHGELRPEAIYVNGLLKIPITGVAPMLVRGSNAFWLGPQAYRAPEESAGAPASARGDLYSVGLILYELLSGLHPFEAESEEETALRQAGHSLPPDLRSYNPAVSAGLEEVVMRLLAYDPARRFATAREAMQALAATNGQGP